MKKSNHKCRNAQDADLKQAILIGLDECLIALEESFQNINDDHIQAFPIPGENNIAWIVMHCLDNLDDCAIGAQSGERLYPSEWRWDLWECSPNERPKPGDPFPTPPEMLERLWAIREKSMSILDAFNEQILTAPYNIHPLKSNRADLYMRTICHTNSHIRQIWYLKGALGIKTASPQQHWA